MCEGQNNIIKSTDKLGALLCGLETSLIRCRRKMSHKHTQTVQLILQNSSYMLNIIYCYYVNKKLISLLFVFINEISDTKSQSQSQSKSFFLDSCANL